MRTATTAHNSLGTQAETKVNALFRITRLIRSVLQECGRWGLMGGATLFNVWVRMSREMSAKLPGLEWQIESESIGGVVRFVLLGELFAVMHTSSSTLPLFL